MNNKEFVEELVNSLNILNKDILLFKNGGTNKVNQTFSIKELRHSWDNGSINVRILLLVTYNNYNNVLWSGNYVAKILDDETLNDIYNIVKLSILKHTLLLKESADMAYVGVPIAAILTEGYGEAKTRIINESK